MNRKTVFLSLMILMPAFAMAGGMHGGHHHGHNSSTIAGEPGKLKDVDRTVTIDMHDNMRFSTDELEVTPGETLKFVIKNKGKLPHEFNIGTKSELIAHKEMMRKMPMMKHDEPNAITLNPGEQGEIIWKFPENSKDIEIGCLIPGHYEAGMLTTVRIVSK